MYTLYRHISPSNKVYIGITCQKPEWRWNHGKGYSNEDQPYFARAIKKHGWDNFKHEILLENLTEEKAKQYEIKLIYFYKMLAMSYNITDGGDGHRGKCSKVRAAASEETRRKMSKSHKGMFAGKLNPMYGRHETAPTYNKYGYKHPASKRVYQYDKDGTFVKKWMCLSDVQRELGILVTNITAVCKGKKFTAGGFRWSYDYPYVFRQDEAERKRNKCNALSIKAKEGYKNGKRKRMSGNDNPMSRVNRLRRQFDAELRQKDKELDQKKEIELKKIEASKVKAKASSSGSSK